MPDRAARSNRDMFTTVSVLLSSARSTSKPPQAKLDALDELSKILLSGRSDSELSVAAITAAWSEPVEDVSHLFLTDNLEKLLLPALGQVMMDRDVAVSSRAALVLSRIGAALGSDAGPFFTWILQGVETQATQDPVRLSIHLSVLSQTLQLGQRDCLEPFVQDIVQRLNSLLERIQHHHLVQPVVLVLQEIASDYPHVLSRHFPDVVDLLVGWSLDAEVPPAARERITRTFANFKTLWQAHLQFADSLVHKFLADIEALHRTLQQSSNAQSLPEMIRLANCCVGVVEGMGSARVEGAQDAVCSRLLRCFEGGGGGAASTQLKHHHQETMHCILRLTVTLLKTASPNANLATEYVLQSIADSASRDPAAASQTLDAMGSMVVAEQGSGLDMAVMASAFLGGGSCIPALRLHHDAAICRATRTLYLRLLDLAGTPAVAELYVAELGSLCAAIGSEGARLWSREGAGEGWHRTLAERSRRIREKEALAVLLVSVLQEWVESKSVAWTARTVHALLRCSVAGMLAGGAQVLKATVLSTAGSYALNLQDQDRKIGQLVVEVAGLCLGEGAPQTVSRCAVDALAAVSGNTHCELSARTTQQLAQLVILAASDADADVRAHAADAAVLVTRRAMGLPGCALMVTRECLSRLSDVDKRVAGEYLWVLSQVSHAALLHPPRLFSKHHSPAMGVRDWQREMAGEAGVAGMRALDLPRFISYISQRGHPDLPVLLTRMQLVSESVTLQSNGKDGLPFLQTEGDGAPCAGQPAKPAVGVGASAEQTPWGWDAERCELWALVEAARFFVRSRLRTSFGGPMQTFEALETMLLEACARGELEVRRGDSVAGQQGNKQGALRMLLHFLGHLERQVFNACEGSVKLPPCGVNSTKFFRGNRKVCEDWFGRLRKSLTRASSVAAAPYLVLEHGLKRLPELCKQVAKLSTQSSKDDAKKLQREVDTLVLTICTALRDVRDADAIEGLAAWAKANWKQLVGVRDGSGWMQALSLQCRGHLQEAEETYREAFRTASNPDVQAFIVKNAVWCCTRLADWDAWRHWRECVQSGGEGGGAALAEARLEIEGDLVRALASFDAGDVAGAAALLERCGGQEAGMGLVESVTASRAMMLKGMLSLQAGDRMAASGELLKAQRLLVAPLCMARMEVGAQLPAATQPLVLLCCIARLQDCADERERAVPLPGEDEVVTEALPKCEASVHELGLWQELLRVVQVSWGASTAGTAEERQGALTLLRLKVASIARKQRNFKYVEGLLSKEGASLPCQYEMAMLRLARHEHAEGLGGLWSLWCSVEDYMAEADDFVLVGAEADAVRDMAVKTLRKIADRMQDPSMLQASGSMQALVDRMAQDTASGWVGWAEELRMPDDRRGAPEGIGGYLLHKCTVMHNEQAKAWAEYASWCYRQGRHQTDSMTRMGASGGGSGRRAKEEALHARIAAALSIGDSGVASGTNELVLRVAEAMNVSGEEMSLDPNTGSQEEALRLALEEICPWAGQQQLDALVQVWRGGRLHALQLYRSAVQAYLEYLRISQRVAEQSAWSDSYDITATLRLLRLLVKYGRDMQDLFAQQLPFTPTRPWRSIVPQLFARLGHAEPRVRDLVRALIMRIGAEMPHAIIYPTVVGHMEVESGGGGPQSKELGGILESLRQARPELVTDVERVISELARCTILKEDELASALQEITQSISGGLRMMREEVLRVRDNTTLSEHDRLRILKEKYDAITKPANLALEPVKKLFSSCADTDHDRAFIANYRQPFYDALQAFREPDVYHADQAWEPMKVLMRSLNRQLRRTSLSLQSVSPFLGDLRSTDIPMPGVAVEEESDEKRLTVQAFQGHMELLLTKTKPKKMTIVGSDGQDYTYLLKGREDLHLDERMMQLLTIVNTFMRQDRASHARDLSARHYAVIPVGPRSGLIQWCQGTIPLFGVYKAWQARQQRAAEGGKDVQPMRPSDMFYEKIMPALKEHGITRVTSRKEWPHEVLKSVYTQLLQETPRDLLVRELWCSCVSSAELWAKTNVHARSVAVMSMVGYVTGLGDRHLDNILMDFGSGEVVHIDWNVCFEKGLKLKVPELVPYRMSQTLQASIGFSGVEGPFRIACEKALRVLRRNKEALLTLLEAFVYDPLVDWTADKVNDQASKNVELHVSLSLFASRVDEMKVVLSENLQRGHSCIGTLQQALANWLHAQTAESACKQEAEEMGGMLRVVQDKLKHLEWEEKETSERLKKMNALQPHVESQWSFTKGKLQEAIVSCAQALAQQDSATSWLRGTQLLARQEQLSLVQRQPVPTSPLSSWAAAMGLFGARAPGGLSDQACLVLEEQLASSFQRALAASMELLAALSDYREHTKELPPEYAKLSRAFEWWEALQRVLDDANPQVVGMIRSHFSAEQVGAKCQESSTMWAQLEAQRQTLRATLDDMRSWLSSTHLEDMEQKLAEARRAALQHEGFNEVGRAAGCVELCGCLKMLLEMKVEGSHDVEPAFAVWGEGLQQDVAQDVEYMDWMWLHDGVWETPETISRIAATCLLVAKDVVHRGLDMLQGFCSSLERVASFSTDLSRVILPEAIRALHSDSDVVLQVRAFLDLAGKVRQVGKELSGALGVENGVEWRQDGVVDGADAGAGRVGQLLGMLSGLKVEYERAVWLENKEASGCRVLLAAFDRVFMSLDKDSGASQPPTSVSWMLNMFVGKVTTMEVLLVGILRCNSVAHAQSKLPAMRARVQRFANDFIRRLVLPRLSDALTDLALPLMPKDSVPPLHARPLDRSAVHSSVSRYLQRSAADARVSAVHASLRRYCEGAAQLRAAKERCTELRTSIQRTEQQLQGLGLKQRQMVWMQGDLLSLPLQGEPQSPADKEWAERLDVLKRLSTAALQGHAAVAALTEVDGRFSQAEQELTRIGQGMPSSSGFSVETINMRIHQRRSALLQPMEIMKEVVGVGQGARVLEQCRASGELGRQMDGMHLELLGRLEEARRAMLAHHHESSMLDSRLKEIAQERAGLRGRAGQLQMGGGEKRRGALEGQEGCRREAAVMCGCVAQVRELLLAEGQLISETSGLLDSVAKVTENAEAVHDIHHVATELKKEQQALKQAAADLDQRIASVPLLAAAQNGQPLPSHPQRHPQQQQQAGRGAEGKAQGLDAAGVRRMERLASQVLATMGLCHSHLGTLAQLASSHAQAIQHEPAEEEGQAPVFHLAGSVNEGGAGEGGGAEGRREQRNAYAVSVLKRVQQKMDGREREGGKMGVAEQVAQTIKDATSPEKLCEMYEGWTPWT